VFTYPHLSTSYKRLVIDIKHDECAWTEEFRTVRDLLSQDRPLTKTAAPVPVKSPRPEKRVVCTVMFDAESKVLKKLKKPQYKSLKLLLSNVEIWEPLELQRSKRKNNRPLRSSQRRSWIIRKNCFGRLQKKKHKERKCCAFSVKKSFSRRLLKGCYWAHLSRKVGPQMAKPERKRNKTDIGMKQNPSSWNSRSCNGLTGIIA